MREIRFRGKRIDNGEWVTGCLKHVYRNDFPPEITSWTDAEGGYYRTDPVNPDTVGQYTGMKDINGKDIYEGDVLNMRSHWGRYVGFDDGAFVAIQTNKVQRINHRPYRLNQEDIDDGWLVTGNIHDNPELLEDGGQK